MATGRQFDFLLVGLRDPATDLPLASGTVETYTAVGTFATGKVAYKTSDTTGANWGAAIDLDAYGRAQAWGDGAYDFIVKNAAGTVVYTFEGYDGTYSVSGAANKLDAASPTLASGNLNMSTTGKIINLAAGTAATDGVRYGQTMVTSGANAMAGNLDMGTSYKIVNLAAPTGAGDGVNKAYADTSGVKYSNEDSVYDASSGTNLIAAIALTYVQNTGYSGVVDVFAGAGARSVHVHIARAKGSNTWKGYMAGTSGADFKTIEIDSAPNPVTTLTLNAVTTSITLRFGSAPDIVEAELSFGAAQTERYVSMCGYTFGNT